MNFTRNTKAAKINTPYIIKTTRDISEFEVNAKVNPGNTKKSIVIEDDETGEEVEIASMTGTYAAGTVVPKNSLFLSGNKFYYSVGKTKMKAFRAYFDLGGDILAEYDGALAKIRFVVDEEPTAIEGIATPDVTGEVFTLQGISLGVQDVQSLPKGIYIIGGKKVNIQ
jgi:hypothetical protein